MRSLWDTPPRRGPASTAGCLRLMCGDEGMQCVDRSAPAPPIHRHRVFTGGGPISWAPPSGPRVVTRAAVRSSAHVRFAVTLDDHQNRPALVSTPRVSVSRTTRGISRRSCQSARGKSNQPRGGERAVPRDTVLPCVDLEDIAPSIAARLDVRLEDVDSRPVPWLTVRSRRSKPGT